MGTGGAPTGVLHPNTKQLDGKGLPPPPWLLKVSSCCPLALAPLSGTPPPERRHSLARFVQKAPGGALAAHKDVLLQGLLVEHPVAHAEGRVACREAEGQGGPSPGGQPVQGQ